MPPIISVPAVMWTYGPLSLAPNFQLKISP